MKELIYLTSIIMTILLWSCNDNPSNPDSEFGIIDGIVINDSLLPLRNVELYTVPGTEVILSNDSGKFNFKKVPEGTYSLYTKKNGYKTKNLEIGVLKGKTSNATIIMSTDTALINYQPNKPKLISPSNGSTKNANVNLKWSCTDPDDDKLKYDLFLGTSSSNLDLIASRIENTENLINDLTLNSTYFWKVVVYDTEGLSNESEIWSFKVEEMIDNSILLKLNFEKDFNDKSNYKQNVSNTNVVLTTDRYGSENSAAYFDGNSYLEVIDPTLMNFSKPFTVCTWVKINQVNYDNTYAGEMDLISRIRGAEPNISSFAFYIKYGKLRGEVYKYPNGAGLIETTTLLSDNEWTHVALVYDGAKLIIFKNGIEVISQNVNTPDMSSLNLFIGRRAQGNRYFTGYMDDIMVISKELDKVGINEIMNN